MEPSDPIAEKALALLIETYNHSTLRINHKTGQPVPFYDWVDSTLFRAELDEKMLQYENSAYEDAKMFRKVNNMEAKARD